MPNIVNSLEHTTHLVKAIGQSFLSDGRTLSEALTIGGISYWDVFAVDLARIYVPHALTDNGGHNFLTSAIRPHLIRAKYSIRDFVRLHKSLHDHHSWPPGDTILCLDFSEHISRDVLQPVVSYLAEVRGKQLVCLRDRPWQNTSAFVHQNIQYQTIWQHWNQYLRLNVYSARRRINRITRFFRESNDLEKIISDIDPTLWEKLEKVFNRFFIADLPVLISQGVLARHIMEEHRPSLVISGDVADPRTRAYTLQCKNLGIPCLEVQFGLAGPEGIEWRFFSADNVAAWGEDAKAAMIGHGIPAKQIVITGSPRHDSLTKLSAVEIESARMKLGVPEGSIVVLLASAYQLNSYDSYSNPDLLRSMKQAVFEAVENSSAICLIVKPHPHEDENETRLLAKSNKNIIFVSRDDDIRELTKICSCFISFGSTATVDALILGKFVICPVFPGWVWSDLFKNTGAVYTPESVEEVREAFKLISTGKCTSVMAELEPARKELLARWTYCNDGLGAERVAQLGLSMLNKTPT